MSSTEPLVIPTLIFLHMDFLGYTTAPLLWRFASLRTLYIEGDLPEATFDALVPFLIAHSQTVTRLHDRASTELSESSSVIKHFPHLELYATSVQDKGMHSVNANEALLTPNHGLRPLTVVWFI